MSLPASQQQVLDGMECALRAGAPRLASMFAIFTRLTRDEAVPRTESLPAGARPSRTWLGGGLTATRRAIVALPLVLGYVALLVFLAATSPAVHGCGHAAGLRAAAVAQAGSCRAAPGPPIR